MRLCRWPAVPREVHRLVWTRQNGRSRVLYDALGHDTTSYDSPGHVALLRRAVRWLLHDL